MRTEKRLKWLFYQYLSFSSYVYEVVNKIFYMDVFRLKHLECFSLMYQYTEKARSILPLYWHRVEDFFSHINDSRELHLPWKGITNDKHTIIPWSPRTLKRQWDLIVSSQKLLRLNDIYFTSCSKTSALKHFRLMCWLT